MDKFPHKQSEVNPDASADELGVEGVRGPQNPPRSDGDAVTSNQPSNWSRFKLGYEEPETGRADRRHDTSPGPSPKP